MPSDPDANPYTTAPATNKSSLNPAAILQLSTGRLPREPHHFVPDKFSPKASGGRAVLDFSRSPFARVAIQMEIAFPLYPSPPIARWQKSNQETIRAPC